MYPRGEFGIAVTTTPRRRPTLCMQGETGTPPQPSRRVASSEGKDTSLALLTQVERVLIGARLLVFVTASALRASPATKHATERRAGEHHGVRSSLEASSGELDVPSIVAGHGALATRGGRWRGCGGSGHASVQRRRRGKGRRDALAAGMDLGPGHGSDGSGVNRQTGEESVE